LIKINQYTAKEIINSIFVYVIAGLLFMLLWIHNTYCKIGAVILGIITILLLIMPDNPNNP